MSVPVISGSVEAIAKDRTSGPGATRLPNWVVLPYSASRNCGLFAPIRLAKRTMSASVMVRPSVR